MLVNPKNPFKRAYLFNISNGLDIYNGNEYEATRQAWRYYKVMDLGGGLAIGLKSAISRGVYDFARWNDSPASTPKMRRCEFETAKRYDTQSGIGHELLSKDYSIITASSGAYNFGSYLVIEFDGNGSFRFIHGSIDKYWRKL